MEDLKKIKEQKESREKAKGKRILPSHMVSPFCKHCNVTGITVAPEVGSYFWRLNEIYDGR
jgi:hypothetical protein